MTEGLDPETARALLEWQIELGATEAIGEAPVDRYALPDRPSPVGGAVGPGAASGAALTAGGQLGSPLGEPGGGHPGGHPGAAEAAGLAAGDPVVLSRALAARAGDLAELREAIAGYEHCELKKGARNLVFADGRPGARVMIVGEAPGREEDQRGLPFVGRAGQLLDRMLAAIGLSRQAPSPEAGVYIINVLPWRPPQNRDPTAEEIAMMLPFVERHIALANPEVLVLMGNIACQAMLGRRGITRLHGQWMQLGTRPALPMFHPAYLLRNPIAKREAWADLLTLQARLRQP